MLKPEQEVLISSPRLTCLGVISLFYYFPPPFSSSQICAPSPLCQGDGPQSSRSKSNSLLPGPSPPQLTRNLRTRQKLGRPRNRTGVSSVVGIQGEPQRSVLTTRLVTLCACCWTQVVWELPVFVWTGAGLWVVRVGLVCSLAPLRWVLMQAWRAW